MSFEVSSGWVGRFKIGDNICHSIEILTELSRLAELSNDADLLVKPRVVLLASICEAMLFDLIENRVRGHTREAISAIPEKLRTLMQSAKYSDEFKKLINIAKANNLLGNGNLPVYINLHHLRGLRNRLHIQSVGNDDSDIFDNDALVRSERITEEAAKCLAGKFPRTPDYQGYVRNFVFPWDEHIQ
ncbi:hypothetical protein COB72_10995 [bacterium]|nr:MAG: hypothetical protein COB72_10995 [bacterium]